MWGCCVGIKEKFNSVNRNRRLSKLTLSLSSTDKRAFERLQKALRGYVTARVDNELDLGGSGYAALKTEAQALEYENFVNNSVYE